MQASIFTRLSNPPKFFSNNKTLSVRSAFLVFLVELVFVPLFLASLAAL